MRSLHKEDGGGTVGYGMRDVTSDSQLRLDTQLRVIRLSVQRLTFNEPQQSLHRVARLSQ